MEEQQSFDEFFRESLADYRETPPPAAWDMVARRLDEDDRRRRGGFFFWPWTVLSVLLLIGGALWLYGWNNHGFGFGSGSEAQRTSGRIKPSTSIAAASSVTTDRTPAANNTGTGTIALPEQQPLTGSQTASASGTAPVATTAPRPDNRTTAPGTAVGASNTETTEGPREASWAGNAPAADASVHGTRRREMPRSADRSAAPEAITAASRMQRAAVAPALAGTAAPRASQPAPTATTPREIVPAPQRVVGATQPVTTTRVPEPERPLAAAQPVRDRRQPQVVPASGILAPATQPVIPGLPARQPGLTPAPAFTETPSPVPANTDPMLLLASLEPVMHFFAGAIMPPVLDIYQTGLLQPETYYEPVEPAPVVAAAASDPAPAPAMYPPDSLRQVPGSIFSLSGFLGYEHGIKTPPRNMLSVGLSMLWKLSDKFAIGMQPTLLYGNLPRTELTSDKAYQRSAVDVTRFTTRDYSPSILGQIDTVNNYVIREAFDSIRVRGTYLKGSLWQLELPLILQFNPFGPALRMYGGPSLYFGGSMKIRSEGATQIYTVDRKDSIVQSSKMTEEQIKNYFGKSSLESYSNYDPNAHSFTTLDPIRFGYQFGIGYQKNRMSFDVSVRQQLSGYHQLSPELRELYATPVFRLSFGYQLIRPRKPTLAPITH